jgi:hypothetical protein
MLAKRNERHGKNSSLRCPKTQWNLNMPGSIQSLHISGFRFNSLDPAASIMTGKQSMRASRAAFRRQAGYQVGYLASYLASYIHPAYNRFPASRQNASLPASVPAQ